VQFSLPLAMLIVFGSAKVLADLFERIMAGQMHEQYVVQASPGKELLECAAHLVVRLINHLLELGTRARHAESMASLDHLQNEADKILKLTMQRVASNELDEGVIKGFALALDQARFAVADRRAVLLGLRHSPDGATESDAAVHELKPALERRAGS